MKNRIVIATRESLLALWQARYVAGKIKEAHPEIDVELLPVTTKGDQILDRPLVEIGGKGLFIKELEVMLLEGQADLAVHSLKDMTAELADGLTLAAVTAREDPRDAFVSGKYASLDELPQHAVVGTSSLRRQAQLLHYRSDLTVKSLRGNVQTRLRHLDEGEYDAVILAADTLEAVSFLHNANIAYCIRAERAFLAKVGGDCKVPAGIFVVPDGRKKIVAKAFIASPDGKELYRGEDGASDAEAEALGERLAEKLLNAGGREILKNLQKI